MAHCNGAAGDKHLWMQVLDNPSEELRIKLEQAQIQARQAKRDDAT
jgi:hypothetical protein